ncbi:MAG: hypothetical protein ABI318_01175 [Chthoniobacteraceae bacterium]
MNYFNGQLLTADDFRAEQDYQRQKHRLHNLRFHGSGVVEGLGVSVARDGGAPVVIVSPGFALDPAGNEIQLCTEVRLRLGGLRTQLHVLIRFAERPADQVPALLQPTRIEEGCEVLLSATADPPASSPDPQGHGSPATVLPLARLVRGRGGWRVDRKFKTPRPTASKRRHGYN